MIKERGAWGMGRCTGGEGHVGAKGLYESQGGLTTKEVGRSWAGNTGVQVGYLNSRHVERQYPSVPHGGDDVGHAV